MEWFEGYYDQLFGVKWEPTEASIERISLIGLSGILGLVIGDYGFFHALATIGPRLASVIMALWPACTVLINVSRGVMFPADGKSYAEAAAGFVEMINSACG